jgi:hypothetical protein
MLAPGFRYWYQSRMSLEHGLAAVNLEMPPRVPRYELSVDHYHWELVSVVTGIDVSIDSPLSVQSKAQREFIRAWNYDIYPCCLDVGADMTAKLSGLGHAEYARHGADFDDNIYCPFKTVEDVFAFDPWETYGATDKSELVRRFNENYRERVEWFPDLVNMTGVYGTLMSAMIAIFGWEMLLLAAGTDPKRFGEVMNRYTSWMQQYYDAVAESETYVIYSHDDIVWTEGAFVHPDWYRTFLFPNLKKLWAPSREAGKKVFFQCDGNYTEFVDDIAACGNHGFWFEIFTDLRYVTEKYGKTHFIIGNGDCRILTFGSKADIRAEVERCMAIGKGCPGYFMSISGHIPPNVPIENALYYNEVYEELSPR